MQGDLTLFTPGERVDAQLVANANGNIAERGDAVQIVGETDDGRVQVALVDTAGAGVATVAQEGEYSIDDADYAAGDVAGQITMLLRNAVDWFPDGGNAFAPGDQVVTAVGGGVRAYDAAGGDTADMLIGRVFRTYSQGEYRTGKVAVVRTQG